MSETAAANETAATGTAERRVSYRSPWPWLSSLAWIAFIVAWLIAGVHAHQSVPVPWAVGVFLIEGASLVAAYRKQRGFTLSAAGITWHAYDMFVPWSNVSEVGVRTVGSTPRLVVQLVEPDQVRDLRPRGNVLLARRNLDRYGGPIAPAVRWLGVPAEELIAEAERFRAAPRPDLLVRPTPSRIARVGSYAGTAGLALVLFAAVTGQVFLPWGRTHHDAGPQKSGVLEFRYQPLSKPGYVDQTLGIGNHGAKPTAPQLAFVALDEKGGELPGVQVRAALGSDKGMMVVPPSSVAYDILAFSGPDAGRVRNVKVSVLGTADALTPMMPSGGLRAEPIDERGQVVAPSAPFTKVRVTSPTASPLGKLDTAAFRVLCVTWAPTRPGMPQQMLTSTELTAPGTVPGGEPVEVPVNQHSPSCDQVIATYARA
ncbi:hypothetical protein [Actinomadura harenae]|uniref:Uncharacterized protein n=1 Tax=Actinomadura harenae TaxID=2483351 RepID=A0A3M2M6Z9_9ACTN|nr:hypothetical protein [Actinomadura harenae]RMI44750.1 hypothetical protein EBO15_12460 [Actinomadura harenae]